MLLILFYVALVVDGGGIGDEGDRIEERTGGYWDGKKEIEIWKGILKSDRMKKRE